MLLKFITHHLKRERGGGGGGGGTLKYKPVAMNAERLIIRQQFPEELCIGRVRSSN